jgi:PAS domain S-box-containing protein
LTGEKTFSAFAPAAWLDVLQEAIVIIDKDCTVQEWNKSMSRLSGICKGEALGCSLFALLPADFRKNLAAPIHLAFSHRQSSEGEFSQRHAENEFFSFRYCVTCLEQEPTGSLVMISLIDKSDRDRLQRQLKKQEKLSLFGRLSSGIAYELAAPLDAICSAIDKMLGCVDKPAKGEIERGLHRILDEVYRISHLSNNIIALAHNEAPSLRYLDVHDVILESIAVLEHDLNRRPVCSLRFDRNTTLVAADPILLRCVLNNLLKSAIDAAGEDAVPLLETSSEKLQAVIIRIEDRGSASAAKNVRRIFEAPPRAQRFELGSELGMYLSKKIIEAHRGSIHAEGRAGRGTVYTITLPATPELSAAA